MCSPVIPEFSLFSGTGLSPADLPFALRQSFPEGASLSFPPGLGLILQGAVRVTQGEGGTLLNTIPAGGMFGASTLLAGDRRPGTTLTARGATEILFLSEKDLVDLLMSNRKLLENYLSFVSRRICFLSGKVGTFASQTAEDKLLRHIAQNGGSVTVKSMTELAAMLSMGRASLYRAADTLMADGRLLRNGHTLTLL